MVVAQPGSGAARQARLESREGQVILTRLLRNVSLHRRTTVTSLASASASSVVRSGKEELVGRERRKTVELRRQRSHSGTGDGQGQEGGGMGIRYLRGWGLLSSRPPPGRADGRGRWWSCPGCGRSAPVVMTGVEGGADQPQVTRAERRHEDLTEPVKEGPREVLLAPGRPVQGQQGALLLEVAVTLGHVLVQHPHHLAQPLQRRLDPALVPRRP